MLVQVQRVALVLGKGGSRFALNLYRPPSLCFAKNKVTRLLDVRIRWKDVR
jgi:hypothetical protein